MAKKAFGNNFSDEFFLKKGFIKNESGGYDPPKYKSPLKEVSNDNPIYLNGTTSVNIGGNLLMAFTIDPIGKPRMTQSDKWKKRKAVVNYFKFKDEIRKQAAERGFTLPQSAFHVVFVLPVPRSIKDAEKAKRIGSPHQQKPDVDNICKGFFDSLLDDDSVIWDCRMSKFWGPYGQILIYKI